MIMANTEPVFNLHYFTLAVFRQDPRVLLLMKETILNYEGG